MASAAVPSCSIRIPFVQPTGTSSRRSKARSPRAPAAQGGSPLTDSAERNFVELVELAKLSRPGALWTHFRTISDRSQHFCSWRANYCFLSCYIIAVISKVLYMVLSRKRSSRHCSLESWSPTNYSRMCGQLSMFRILSVHFPDSGITGNDANDGNNTRL